MINRYFTQNALISGPLQFLAGFGQKRQEVHNIEAGYENQQNRQLEQSIGQGIQQAGHGIGQGLLQRGQNRMAQALLAQRGQQALDFENQRSANDLLQMLEQSRMGAMGVGGRGRSNIPAFDVPAAIAAPIEQMGPMVPPAAGGGPEVPMSPLQAQPPDLLGNTANLDPMHVQAYQKASNRLAELNTQYDEIMTSERPPQEKYSAASRLIPAIAEQRQLQHKYQRPAPPRTEQELIAAGAMNGGFTVLSDGKRFWRDPDGNGHFDVPTKQQEADRPLQVPMPDGTVVDVDADFAPVPESMGGGVITRKGVQYHAPPAGSRINTGKLYDDARKALEKDGVVPKKQAIYNEMIQRQELVDKFEQQQGGGAPIGSDPTDETALLNLESTLMQARKAFSEWGNMAEWSQSQRAGMRQRAMDAKDQLKKLYPDWKDVPDKITVGGEEITKDELRSFLSMAR